MTDAELGEQTVNAAVGAALRATAEEPMDVRTDALHFAELRSACRACDRAITALFLAEGGTSVQWIKLAAAGHRARKVLAKADGS